jgi:hypothetical protein
VVARGRGEHAADPGAEREADHGERGPVVGVEAVAEHLLEPAGDRELVGQRARPERGLAGGPRGHGDHVACREVAVAAQLGQRVAAKIFGLGHEWQAAPVIGAAHRCRLDAALPQERGVGGNAGRSAVEHGEQRRHRICARPFVEQPVEVGLDEALDGRERVDRPALDTWHRVLLRTDSTDDGNGLAMAVV